MRRYRPYNDDGVTLMARKHKRRKGQYLKGFSGWTGKDQVTKRLAARRSRRQAKRDLA